MSIDVLAKAVNLLIFIDRLSSFNTWDRNKYCTYFNIRFSIIMIFHSLHVEHCHFQFPFLSSRWVYSLLFLIKVISTRCAWDDKKEEKKNTHTHTRSIEKTMKLKIHFLSKWFIIIFIRWLSFPRMQVDWHFSKTEYTLSFSHFSPSLSVSLVHRTHSLVLLVFVDDGDHHHHSRRKKKNKPISHVGGVLTSGQVRQMIWWEISLAYQSIGKISRCNNTRICSHIEQVNRNKRLSFSITNIEQWFALLFFLSLLNVLIDRSHTRARSFLFEFTFNRIGKC